MKTNGLPFARKVRKLKALLKEWKAEQQNRPAFAQTILNRARRLYEFLRFRVSARWYRKAALQLLAAAGLTVGAAAQQQPYFRAAVTAPFNSPTLSQYGTYFYAMEFADIDNDGDLDLFINEVGYNYTTYNYDSKIRFIENIGTATVPNFNSTPQLNPFNITIPTNSIKIFPQFTDLDNDGDLDLMLGGQYGVISYYENIGTANVPNFATSQLDPFNIDLDTTGYQYFLKAIPGDLDNDGDYDLPSISLYGSNMFYQENIGTTAIPDFDSVEVNPFHPTNPGVYNYAIDMLDADMADVDGDGDLDVLVFSYDNFPAKGLFFYENTGTITSPVFDTAQSTNHWMATAFTNDERNMALADIDNDGDQDLFTMDYYGVFRFYENAPVAGTIEFDSTSITINESVGTLAIPISINTADTSTTFSVEVVLGIGGAAIEGQDFTFSNPQTITFTPPNSGPAFVNIPINDDALTESTENFFLILQNPNPGTAITGGVDSMVVNIIDNDIPVKELNFSTSTLSVPENAGLVSLSISLSNADVTPVSVDVTWSSTNATQNSDFIFNDTTITFPASSTSPQVVSVNMIDDAIVESAEQIELQLSNATGGGVLGSTTTLVLTINDNDVVGVQSTNWQTDFKLFPNPAKDILQVKLKGELVHRYEIYDFKGQLLQHGQLQTGLNSLSLQGLPAGHYLLRLSDPASGAFETRKFEKQ